MSLSVLVSLSSMSLSVPLSLSVPCLSHFHVSLSPCLSQFHSLSVPCISQFHVSLSPCLSQFHVSLSSFVSLSSLYLSVLCLSQFLVSQCWQGTCVIFIILLQYTHMRSHVSLHVHLCCRDYTACKFLCNYVMPYKKPCVYIITLV
jgi:hypothetical protein